MVRLAGDVAAMVRDLSAPGGDHGTSSRSGDVDLPLEGPYSGGSAFPPWASALVAVGLLLLGLLLLCGGCLVYQQHLQDATR